MDVNPLRVIRAAETVGVFVVVADLELTVSAVARIPPFVLGVWSPGIETVHVSLVRVAAILAIQVARQRRTHRASDHNAGDRRACTSAAMTEDVAQETPDHRAADDARGVYAPVAVSIVGIILDRVIPRITRAPPIFGLDHNNRRRWRSVIHGNDAEDRLRDHPSCDFDEISITVNDDPAMAGTRQLEMIDTWFRDEISRAYIDGRKSFTPPPHLLRLTRRKPVGLVRQPGRPIAVAVKPVVAPTGGDSPRSAQDKQHRKRNR